VCWYDVAAAIEMLTGLMQGDIAAIK